VGRAGVRHKGRPGKRDELRKAWESYARDYIATAAVQLAYFYCYDDKESDVIVAFRSPGRPAPASDR